MSSCARSVERKDRAMAERRVKGEKLEKRWNRRADERNDTRRSD